MANIDVLRCELSKVERVAPFLSDPLSQKVLRQYAQDLRTAVMIALTREADAA